MEEISEQLVDEKIAVKELIKAYEELKCKLNCHRIHPY